MPLALVLSGVLTLSGQGAALPSRQVLPLVVDPPAVFEAPVTVSRSTSRVPGDDLLALQNGVLRRLARDKRVYLVAVDACFSGVNGAFSPDFSSDGLHLNSRGCAQWFQYLRTHTMGT